MNNLMAKLFRAYLAKHHPDMLLELEEVNGVDHFILTVIESLDEQPDLLASQGLPGYLIEETCLQQFTQVLGPSLYDYLLSLLAEHFSATLTNWSESNLLPWAVVALLATCRPVFDHFGFNDEIQEDERFRNELITAIYRFLRPSNWILQVDTLLQSIVRE